VIHYIVAEFKGKSCVNSYIGKIVHIDADENEIESKFLGHVTMTTLRNESHKF